MTLSAEDVRALDNAAWLSLTGEHARFARVDGNGAAYDAQVSPFAGSSVPGEDADWAALLEMSGGSALAVKRPEPGAPEGPGWVRHVSVPLHQMVLEDEAAFARTRLADAELEPLDVADVDEMLALVELTHPGPFERRTIELGMYRGVRTETGTLGAMAGARMAPLGWVEISAVCTHPDQRGRGLAATLVVAVARDILATDRRPFLHVAVDNVGARAVYERLGFVVRRGFVVDVLVAA
jgi:predicted GNAT family acetyltransferase